MVSSVEAPAAFFLLLAFYDFPAEHWIHLRATNPIESTFATVRFLQRVTKGPGSRAAGVAMAFKLIGAAQTRWRMVNAPHLVAMVRAGATVVNGTLVERPDDQDQQGRVKQPARDTPIHRLFLFMISRNALIWTVPGSA